MNNTAEPYTKCSYCGEALTCEHGRCTCCETCRECVANLRKAAVALGRLGGLASKGKTSEAKKKASRENGKKGGWPKGKPRKVKEIAK